MDSLIDLLKNNEKWYLGKGDEIVWTPPFPLHLDKTGFWDKANFYNFDIEPIFTISILDSDGNEIPYKFLSREWTPAYLKQIYLLDHRDYKVEIEENKVLKNGNLFVSSLSFKNWSKNKIKLNLIMWTLQVSIPSKGDNYITDIKFENKVSFIKNIESIPFKEGKLSTPLRLLCNMWCDKKIKSYAVNIAEKAIMQPEFKYTPFYENFNKNLPDTLKTSGVNDDGIIYFAEHFEINIKSKSNENCNFYFKIADIDSKVKVEERIPSKQVISPKEESIYDWIKFTSTIPHFECSDEYFTKYYWYRWYGLRLLTLPPKGNIKYPAIAEGISYFRAPITYSAQCHILETRWMHSPEIAQGSLLNWIENQMHNGSFPGYLDFGLLREEMFYHANWGKVVDELNNIHDDKRFLKKAYDGLVKYNEYFEKERDREYSGLYDIINHYETGQEYMNRYMAVNPKADEKNWGDVFRMKGVEVTVYIYELKKFLAKVAGILDLSEEKENWLNEAKKIKESILNMMWDADTLMFYDLNCSNMQKTKVKAATCFYPYFTDIIDESHIQGLYSHLLNKNEFWTKYPVPSSSQDDIYYNAYAEWKGKRHSCPWNGRVWPMTNSHIAEALAYSAINIDNKLARYAVQFIDKYLKMMFHNGDINRPNCYEHYNPDNGKACVYRGINDYQHSWVVDLIIKYIAGVQFNDSGILINPLPFNLKFVKLSNLKIRNKIYSLTIKNNTYNFYCGDKLLSKNKIGIKSYLPL